MIAILSDIHGNFPALEAVLQDAISLGCSRFISLGDVVGYYAQPGQCIDRLKQHNTLNIMGNHDSYVATDTNCTRSKTVAVIIDYQRRMISQEQLAWLRQSAPSYRQDRRLFLHGGPEDPLDQYIYSVSRATIPPQVDFLFCGHTHVQIVAEFGGRTFCNPGSVGQPRDGDWRSAYAILHENNIILRRVEYDVGQTVEGMKKAGFEAFCYDNLFSGSQIGGRIDQISVSYD